MKLAPVGQSGLSKWRLSEGWDGFQKVRA